MSDEPRNPWWKLRHNQTKPGSCHHVIDGRVTAITDKMVRIMGSMSTSFLCGSKSERSNPLPGLAMATFKAANLKAVLSDKDACFVLTNTTGFNSMLLSNAKPNWYAGSHWGEVDGTAPHQGYKKVVETIENRLEK